MSLVKKVNSERSDNEIQSIQETDSLNRQIEQLKREKKSLQILADERAKLIDDYHAAHFDIPRQKISKARSKGSFVRVAFGDTHGASLDQSAWSAFLADMEILKPRVMVHLGDVLDCGGWLAAHHTMNYVAQTDYTYADEVVVANVMLDQLQSVRPTAEIHAIEGNHDGRIATWAITVAQKQRADVELLIKSIGPQHVLNLEKRGIKWWSRGDCHHGSVAGGTIKLGHCYFTHPQSASKHHAAKMVSTFGKNVVYGHTHRRDYFPGGNVQGEEWAAWSPGCLCVKRKYWHHTEMFGHTQGYHLQFVQPDGSFLGVNVPIINGKSYLSGLLRHA